ncbi:MAG: J domain-containing protein [Granulosicoccus sp.]
MSTLPDFYQLLHLQTDAPVAVIKASYRAMMQKMQHHPDLGGDEATAKLLNEAVATLCNEDQRTIYDLKLAIQKKRHANADSTSVHAASEREAENATDSQSETDGDSNENEEKATKPNNEPPSGSFPIKPSCPFCQTSYPISAGPAPAPYKRDARCPRCNGAATPLAIIETLAPDELRKIHRYQHVTAASVWRSWPLDTPVEVTFCDLSPAGCALHSNAAFVVDSVVLLDSHMLNAICTVRYSKYIEEKEVFTVGLEFLTLDLFSRPGTIFSSCA